MSARIHHAAVATQETARVFFSHIPKNGGMMLRFFLENQFNRESVCTITDWTQLLLAEQESLAHYRLFRGHFALDAVRIMPECSTISFLREPIERTLSLMMHMRRDPAFHILHERAKHLSLHEMLYDDEILMHLANHQTSYLGSQLDLVAAREQAIKGAFDIANFMTAPDLGRALDGLDKLRVIGLTEHLDESCARLCAAFGMHPYMTYPRRNHASASERSQLLQLSEADLARVAMINSMDIELYKAAQAKFREHAAPPFRILVQHSLATVAQQLQQDEDWDLARPIKGGNWYEPEVDALGNSYRWSGPELVSTLELPLDLGPYSCLTCELFALPGHSITDAIEACVNGEITQTGTESPDGRLHLRMPLTMSGTALAQGFHQIVLRYTGPVVPAKGKELRNLHFGLAKVRLEVAKPDGTVAPALEDRMTRVLDSWRAQNSTLAAWAANALEGITPKSSDPAALTQVTNAATSLAEARAALALLAERTLVAAERRAELEREIAALDARLDTDSA